MSDIWVNCSHCGQVFSTPDEMAGQSMACPQCGKQIAVIASGVPSEDAPKLQVKHDNTITGGKRCPYCGATMSAEAVICIRCGYDTRTGVRHLENSNKSRLLQWVLWGFGLIILAGITKTFLLQGGSKESGRTVMPPAQKAPVAAASAMAAATNEAAVKNEIVATNKTAATNETAAAQPVSGIQTTLPPVVVSTDKSPVDIAKIEADYRATLNQQLGATYPMAAPGEEVILRRSNGLVHRGTLTELKSDRVVVVGNGQTNEIPLKALDRASRLKCDPAFRAQVVDFHVQKRMKDLIEF
jgi:uncharacterized OB-fold protein